MKESGEDGLFQLHENFDISQPHPNDNNETHQMSTLISDIDKLLAHDVGSSRPRSKCSFMFVCFYSFMFVCFYSFMFVFFKIGFQQRLAQLKARNRFGSENEELTLEQLKKLNEEIRGFVQMSFAASISFGPL